MDAVEFLKGLDRMCGYYKGGCVDCPARDARCMLGGVASITATRLSPSSRSGSKSTPSRHGRVFFWSIIQRQGLIAKAYYIFVPLTHMVMIDAAPRVLDAGSRVMDCFNHLCPFRQNTTSNYNRCECVACHIRCEGPVTYIAGNQTLTADEIARMTND